MANKPLEIGEWHAGILFSGGEGAYALAAVLSFESSRGVRLEIPHIGHGADAQFTVVRGWFRSHTPPKSLVFSSGSHRLALFGLRWGGYSEYGNVTSGVLFAEDAVAGTRVGDATDDLTLTELQSQMDALYEWTAFRAANYETVTDAEGFVRRIEASVETVDELSWKQGDATLSLTTRWSTDNSRPGLHVDEWTVLRSVFDEPRGVEDHMKEHVKVRLLLSILYGAEVSFRRHDVVDERFHPRTLGGEIYSRSGQQLFTARTFREASRPPMTEETLRKGVAALPQIGKVGLELWGAKFDQWKRFIHPAAGILSRERAFLEDRVVSLSMSLEAAGQLLGKADGEEATYRGGRKPETMATYVFRCVASLDVDWARAADSQVGIARAVADNYRKIKHFDTGDDFPNGDETFLVSQVAAVVVRLLTANLVVPDGSLAQNWQTIVEDAFGWFETHALRINDDGIFAMVE
ncbi:hypothetical protein [uncultured Salinibacterium sp.]|uniref:ApeA N-terminal domain 1-containing protein n=1 Tax=uncultured Salinibacterium sp. TaxID=459274 RepID=UPI0030D98434|tara:strand:- start:181403 stop:182794 length:1392 start_codon:yes stop_codon:yes gene_type:complete